MAVVDQQRLRRYRECRAGQLSVPLYGDGPQNSWQRSAMTVNHELSAIDTSSSQPTQALSQFNDPSSVYSDYSIKKATGACQPLSVNTFVGGPTYYVYFIRCPDQRHLLGLRGKAGAAGAHHRSLPPQRHFRSARAPPRPRSKCGVSGHNAFRGPPRREPPEGPTMRGPEPAPATLPEAAVRCGADGDDEAVR
jgi:hypothetical protein